jgi:hypothetical protein
MKTKIKAKDLEDLIVEAELDVKRKQMNLKNGWSEFKHGMRPGNLVKDMLFSKSSSNGISKAGETGNSLLGSGLPGMAAKAAAGFLLNRWMVKKSYGATKMAAGMLVQTGLAAMLSRWAAKRLSKPANSEK